MRWLIRLFFGRSFWLSIFPRRKRGVGGSFGFRIRF